MSLIPFPEHTMATKQAIRFRCKCGHIMKTSVKHAGQKTRCPKCQGKVRVPTPRKREKPKEEEVLDLGAFAVGGGVDLDSGDSNAFTLDEPVEEQGAYDLADEAEPAWMQHAEAAEAMSANLPKLGQKHQPASKSSGPSLGTVIARTPMAYYLYIPAVLFFIAAILKETTGVNLFDYIGRDGPNSGSINDSSNVMLYIGIGLAIVATPFSLYMLWKSYRLLDRGVEVHCHIVKYGMADKGMQNITVQYVYNQKTYKRKICVDEDEARYVKKLLIDPKRPKRCMPA